MCVIGKEFWLASSRRLLQLEFFGVSLVNSLCGLPKKSAGRYTSVKSKLFDIDAFIEIYNLIDDRIFALSK